MSSCEGSIRLADLVTSTWGGGRLLFLPTRLVVKPRDGEDEAGHRDVIGRISESISFADPDGRLFDLSDLGQLKAGDVWYGPNTIGLECVLESDGSLSCRWYHPNKIG